MEKNILHPIFVSFIGVQLHLEKENESTLFV
jgi:hypothetical protein